MIFTPCATRRAARRNDPCHRGKGSLRGGKDCVLLGDPQVGLENALVTADLLHNNQVTVRVIA